MCVDATSNKKHGRWKRAGKLKHFLLPRNGGITYKILYLSIIQRKCWNEEEKYKNYTTRKEIKEKCWTKSLGIILNSFQERIATSIKSSPETTTIKFPWRYFCLLKDTATCSQLTAWHKSSFLALSPSSFNAKLN